MLIETMLAIPTEFVWSHHPETPVEPLGFRSEAEIKALRILDEMEDERDRTALVDMSGQRCAKRQQRLYAGYQERASTR